MFFQTTKNPDEEGKYPPLRNCQRSKLDGSRNFLTILHFVFLLNDALPFSDLHNSWQVGGPLAQTNKFLKKHPTKEKIAIGGIMNAKNKAPLRIDTTQHQMHALMMALESLFPEQEVAS